MNDGKLQLSTKQWSQIVDIQTNKGTVSFSLCGQDYKVINTISTFYNKLNKSLEFCNLKNLQTVNINIIEDPFLSIPEKISNSILRKLLI